MALYQQGDVLIESVREIPSDAEKVDPAEHGNILARGEVTGHMHRVDGFMEMYRRAAKNGETQDVFMSAPKRIVLRHDEHGPVSIPKGFYRVAQVQEYDHFSEEVKAVLD